MPDARLARTRMTLPDAYRFGDAGPSLEHLCRGPFVYDVGQDKHWCQRCRTPHDDALPHAPRH